MNGSVRLRHRCVDSTRISIYRPLQRQHCSSSHSCSINSKIGSVLVHCGYCKCIPRVLYIMTLQICSVRSVPRAGVTSIGVHNLSPGMVLTDLLLKVP